MATMVARTGLNVPFIQSEVYTPRGTQCSFFTVTEKMKYALHFF